MKKILGLLGSAALLMTAGIQGIYSVQKNKSFNEFVTEIEQPPVKTTHANGEIIKELNSYFDDMKLRRNLFDDYEIVTNYFKYDDNEEQLFVDIDKMNFNGIDSKLIDILQTDDFKYELNLAFKNEMFVYKNDIVQYTPFLEEQQLNISQSNSVQRSSFNFGKEIKLFTKWYWFGTYKMTATNKGVAQILYAINTASTAIGLADQILGLIPTVGPIAKAIVYVIGLYLFVLGVAFNWINKGNGVYFWATGLIVYYIKAL